MSEDEVRERMRELSESLGGPPPELEAKLRMRFRARRRAAGAPRWAWAAAAMLAFGLGLGVWLDSGVEVRPAAEPPGEQGFLLLDYGRPTHELTAGRLVRVTLPPTAPAWFGFPVDPGASEGIEADVLIGDDGVAQAVRFVQ